MALINFILFLSLLIRDLLFYVPFCLSWKKNPLTRRDIKQYGEASILYTFIRNACVRFKQRNFFLFVLYYIYTKYSLVGAIVHSKMRKTPPHTLTHIHICIFNLKKITFYETM